METQEEVDEDEREELLTQEWINSLLVKKDVENEAIDQLRDHLISQIQVATAFLCAQLSMDLGTRANLINLENLKLIAEIMRTVYGRE